MHASQTIRRPVRKRIYVLFTGFSLVLALLIVAAAEMLLGVFAPPRWRLLAERKHTEFDPLLGWVNAQSVNLADGYAPGVSLRTNSRRFRGDRELDDSVPAGKTRIICSGDSFTLGFGVGDNDTYPQQLEGLDPRLEVVNMGQGGYGVDQSYLWYQRDATFEHDIQVFAFITHDLRRMRAAEFFGYAKPLLRVDEGLLRPVNTPLSNVELASSNLTSMLSRVFNKSQLARAGRSLLGKSQESADGVLAEDEWECFEAILAELDRLNKERHSVLCVAYLPTNVNDYTGHDSDRARERIRRFCEGRLIRFLDVVASWKALPSVEDVAPLISEVTEHYSPAGNHYIAGEIYRGLQELELLPDAQGSPEPPNLESASDRATARR